MICPVCGTHIDDGSVVCRACHARITVLRTTKRDQGRWCSSCGVRLSWDDDICPHCGLPQERQRTTVPPSRIPQIGRIDLPSDMEDGLSEDELKRLSEDAEATGSVDDTDAFIESAMAVGPAPETGEVPQAQETTTDQPPSRRSVALGLGAALVVMGGLVVLISHPWHSGSTLVGTTGVADPTVVGFPGTVEGGPSQDDESGTTAAPAGDDAAFAQLTEAYGKLMRYQERADGNEELLYQASRTGSLSDQTQGRRACEALAADVDGLMGTLAAIDMSSGAYADELGHLQSLGGWLQKRVDALSVAWKAVAERDGDQMRVGLRGQDTYKVLFERRCLEWEPKQD